MILSAAAGVVVDAQRKRLRAAAPLRAGATLRGLAANAVLDESAKRRIVYESEVRYQYWSNTILI